MNSRLIIAALVTLIVFSSLLSTVAPEVGAEKVDAHEFVSLEAYGVDREYILKALGSYPNASAQLRSLVLQASANNLTPAQVQTVFREILNPPASVSQGVYGQLSEDGKYFKMPSGRTVPNRHAHITLKSQFANTDAAGVGVSAFSSTFRNVVDPSDQSGVYWLVQSRTDYD
ncbi:MAG: hypothetical protein DDT34_02080 [Firmicutes bacterium]|nr:hypothetical protein [Bacillota bacterium]